MEKILFTSESVSEGHPDKLADQISDAILDACLKQDKLSRVACEVFITTELVVVGGEITTSASLDVEVIVRETLRKIGYTDSKYGIGCDTCVINNVIHGQSHDIKIGVDESADNKKIGAGDQGIMFGYATNETSDYMPLAISIAHALVRRASKLRHEGKFKWARPDMKSQVTVDYTNPDDLKIDTILMSIQHDDEMMYDEFKKYVKNEVMDYVIKEFGFTNLDYKVLINPTGRFVTGGPHGDAGLTGRKIIVDTYGGAARHGGGAFSGKDSTKVDRSAAYAARYVAKNIVASGACDRCEIQLSYAIGVSEPTSIAIETFGSNKVDINLISKYVRENIDLTPSGIISMLDLRKPVFSKTSKYGHFGFNSKDQSWEQLDHVANMKKKFNL